MPDWRRIQRQCHLVDDATFPAILLQDGVPVAQSVVASEGQGHSGSWDGFNQSENDNADV